MKKKFASVLLLSAAAMAILFGACSNNDPGKQETGETYTVMFNYNYDGAPSSLIRQVQGGTAVAEPDEPERDGYGFDDWFTDKNCTDGNEYDFSSLVTGNMILYAGWTSTSATVTFNYNYVGAPAMTTQTVDIGEKVEVPAEPVRKRYDFTGWYIDAACTQENKFDFNTAVDGSLTLYAGWLQTEAIITFNYNYPDAPEADMQELEIGNKIEEPDEPLREGYDFIGWFTDADAETKYDFNSTPAGDITLYAGWATRVLTVTFDPNYTGAAAIDPVKVEYGKVIDEPEISRDGYICIWQLDGKEYNFDTPVTEDITLVASWQSQSSDSFTATFYYNYNGATSQVYASQTVAKYGKPSRPENPQRDGYYFVGWYKDAACTEEFDFDERLVSASVSAYALWYKDYVFEAEYTNFYNEDGSPKPGFGYSVNLNGTDVIQKDDGSTNASNGYYVSGLYQNGLSLDFVINAGEDIDDAIVIISIGAEYFDMTFSPDNVKVVVNGDQELDYASVTLDGETSDIQNPTVRRPFTDVVMITRAHLEKGENIISIVIDNYHDYGTGTMKATAPMVDCIHVCTNGDLWWTPIVSNIKGK